MSPAHPVPADLVASASVWPVLAGAAALSFAGAMGARCLDVSGRGFDSTFQGALHCKGLAELPII
jgi:hypothetical protein